MPKALGVNRPPMGTRMGGPDSTKEMPRKEGLYKDQTVLTYMTPEAKPSVVNLSISTE